MNTPTKASADDHGAEERERDPDTQVERETAYASGRRPKEHRRGDQGGDVAVKDRAERLLETRVDGRAQGLAGRSPRRGCGRR